MATACSSAGRRRRLRLDRTRGRAQPRCGSGRPGTPVASRLAATSPIPDALAPARAALAQVRGALEMVGLGEALPALREADALLAGCTPGAQGARAHVDLCRHACSPAAHASGCAVLRGQSRSMLTLRRLAAGPAVRQREGRGRRDRDARNVRARCSRGRAGACAARAPRAAAVVLGAVRRRGPGGAVRRPCSLEELGRAALPHPGLSSLVGELRAAVGVLRAPPAVSAARELAVALLFLDDVLAAWPEAGRCCGRTGRSSDAASAGVAWPGRPTHKRGAWTCGPEPVRRSQERVLAASLGAELLTLLRAAEQRLVAYFEDGAQRDSLDLAAQVAAPDALGARAGRRAIRAWLRRSGVLRRADRSLGRGSRRCRSRRNRRALRRRCPA